MNLATVKKRLKILLELIIILAIIKYLATSVDTKNKNIKYADFKEYNTLASADLYKEYTSDGILKEIKRFADLPTTSEDDPQLIEFVKSLLKPPSNEAYNFHGDGDIYGDYSQEGQSSYVDEILSYRTNGFYIGKVFMIS